MSKSRNQNRLGVECLESRQLMAWGTVPPPVLPTGGDRITIGEMNSAGNYQHTQQITRGEVDAYKFTAQRSGAYTFEAAKVSGSQIDTVIALYDSNNRRLSYNDDANGSTNSKMMVNLTAGRTYSFAISNYINTANGKYSLKFTAPNLSVSVSTDLGRVYSSGSASLNGTTLSMTLNGQTMNNFGRTHHYINVQILDRNGRPIHSGSWSGSFNTAGEFVPGAPMRDSETWSFDLRDWDLSDASRLSIEVGYN